MVVYNFKTIKVVPGAKDLVDIVLSSTTRKTPTEVHASYAISRIRAFYMRKVKFAQQTFHDRLAQVLDDFPVLDDLHPFYADLLNILYDKDHYKLALGQLATARRLVDGVATEHLRFLKYGDSLYRCKQLKRAALGRMCTIVKHQAASLAYLEQVRQHLARLPSIDPSARTLICTGYPNVGKSSMLNRLTRAAVEVQPYAFTTKSLFVGHMDYEYLRWQVIDTPGILDHPLEERNTIEMQGITALAHLRAAVLFVLDISAQCGYTIAQQVGLFESIRPLFSGRPLVVALNKIDVVRPDQLDPDDKELLKKLEQYGATLVPMSTLTEEGVAAVKRVACEALLAQRTEEKLQGAKAQSILSRIHLAQPKPRDRVARPPCIPESVFAARTAASAAAAEDVDDDAMAATEVPQPRRSGRAPAKTRAEEELEQEEREREMLEAGENPWGDLGQDREQYLLENPEWKQDVMPEIVDGRNIADFVDPDILKRLEELEREEELLYAQAVQEGTAELLPLDEEEAAEEALASEIRERRNIARVVSQQRRVGESRRIARSVAPPRTVRDLQQHLQSLGVDSELAEEAAGNIARHANEDGATGRQSRKRARSLSRVPVMDEAPIESEKAAKAKKREKSRSRSRSVSAAASKEVSVPDVSYADKLKRLARRVLNKSTRVTESDRHIAVKMPKHLFSGKRKMGKLDRR